MTQSKHTINTERARLARRYTRIGKKTDIGSIGYFVFGILLVGLGLFFIFKGIALLPSPPSSFLSLDPSSFLAPTWAATTFGGLLVFCGITLVGRAALEYLHKRRCRKIARNSRWSSIHADHPWDPKGTIKSPWSKVAQSFFPILVFTVLLVPANIFIFRGGDFSIFFVVLLVAFDLVYLLGVFELIRRFIAAIKFGKSAVEYGSFPFVTGKRIELRWRPPKGLKKPDTLTFTLRCVEEWFEITGSSNRRSKDLVHEQLWASTKTVNHTTTRHVDSRVVLSFDVPETALGSYISAGEHIRFWELEVVADVPGLDFEERYLVPIYEPA